MATKITAPVKGYNGIVAGVHFSNGTAETDNPGALAYFRRHGYGVASQTPAAAGGQRGPAENLSGFSVPELRKYAKDKGIDLGSAKSKDDVLAAIERAVSPVHADIDPLAAAAVEEESVQDTTGGKGDDTTAAADRDR